MIKADKSRFSASATELTREFQLADTDGDGRLQYEEFRRVLEGLDAGMSEREMHQGFHEVDTDRDGLISCAEFIDWWRTD
jgi:Ca2+-binding EF-hand superfamily protein